MNADFNNLDLDHRDDFDHLIESAMGEVPVPDGLESRLLERLRLATSESSQAIEEKPTASEPTDEQSRVSRRRWTLGISTTVAALVVAVAAIIPLLDFTTPPQVEWQQLADAITFDAKSFTRLPAAEDPMVLPSGRWQQDIKGQQTRQLRLSTSGANAEQETVMASIIRSHVEFKGRRANFVLIAVPAENVAADITAQNLANASIQYGNDSVSVTWQENGQVYVCAAHSVNDMTLIQEYAFGGAV